MTVRELIELLQDIDDDNKRVVFSPDNGGGYVDDIMYADLKPVLKFFGSDELSVVLYGEQLGRI